MTVYTAGVWTVKPGREDDFVALWAELAEWTSSVFTGAKGTLLRSREDPRRFVSFGPWESVEQIEAWRASPEWQELVSRLQEVLDAFEPGTYDVAATSGS